MPLKNLKEKDFADELATKLGLDLSQKETEFNFQVFPGVKNDNDLAKLALQLKTDLLNRLARSNVRVELSLQLRLGEVSCFRMIKAQISLSDLPDIAA
jgi:hypothetical protein